MSQRFSIVIMLSLAGCADLSLGTERSSIIGGELAGANEFPTVVALEQGPGNWFCTGTLVDKSWVLSAAHCVEGAPAGAVKIRFDDLDVNDAVGGMEIDVTEIHAHPGFGQTWGQDIAVLKLATPVDRTVTPIHRATIPFDSAVTQVGYGVTDDNGSGGGILRKLAERNADCAGTGDPEISNDKVLCFDPADGRGGCYGDSGGPTFIAGANGLEVVGVTSGGTGQACTDSWGIWTLVPAELAFIDMFVGAPEPQPEPEPEPQPEPEPEPELPGDDDDGGCSSSGGHAGGALALFALGLVLRRRRR